MATERLFNEIAHEYLEKANEEKSIQASELYTRAAQSSMSGDINQAREFAHLADSLIDDVSEGEKKVDILKNEVLPYVLSKFAELGIQDPPVAFLEAISKIQESQEEQMDSVINKESKRSNHHLTNKQIFASKAFFRLVEDEDISGVTLEEALNFLLSEEEIEDLAKLKTQVTGNWKYSEGKYERIAELLVGKTFPLSVKDLENLDLSSETKELLFKIGEKIIYKDKTVLEAYTFASEAGWGPLESEREDEEMEKGLDKKLNFTRTQNQATQAVLRIVESGYDKNLSVWQAVQEVYSPEELEDANSTEFVRDVVKANWKGAWPKLVRVFDQISEQTKERASIPLDVNIINGMSISNENKELFLKLNEVPAYQGMDIEELLEYTKTIKPIYLGYEAESEDKNIENQNKFLGNEEQFFIAMRAIRGAKLNDEDIERLSDILSKFNIDEDNMNIEQVEKSIQESVSMFLSLNEAQKNEFYDTLSPDEQLLLAIALTSK